MTIIEEIRTDPEAGARRLERECKPGLLALARRLCADQGDAEELVNRTLAEAVAHIDSLLSQSALFGWMCQILVGCHSKDTRRKSNDEIVYPGSVPDVPDEASQEAIFRNLDHAMLREAIDNLPKEDREILLLHYFMDIPIPRMAKVLAIPAGTVKSRLHYARRALAAKLGAATKKPGARALLAALLLTALSAAGAAVVVAVRSAATTMHNAQNIMHNAQCIMHNEDGEQQAADDRATVNGERGTGNGESETPPTFNLSTLQPFNPSTNSPSTLQLPASCAEKKESAMNTKTRATILSAAAALTLTAANVQAGTIYVTADADGTGDGSSWASPATVGTAFSAAASTDEIWLKEGDYSISDGLVSANAITVRGGFAGTESAAAERAAGLRSVLYGGTNTISLIATSGTIELDGLVISNATVRGIYKKGNASLTVKDCTICDNGPDAQAHGLGLYAEGNASSSTLVLDNLEFRRNRTGPGHSGAHPWDVIGHAAYVKNFKSASMTDCLFLGNGLDPSYHSNIPGRETGWASIAYFEATPVSATRCRFIGNRIGCHGNKNDRGGRIVALNGNCSGSVFDHCLWTGNAAVPFSSANNIYGGMVYAYLGNAAHTVALTGCTIAYNMAPTMSCAGLQIRRGAASVRDSILYGNLMAADSSWGKGADIYLSTATASIDIDYSLLAASGAPYLSYERGAAVNIGSHMLYGDPLFATPLSGFTANVNGGTVTAPHVSAWNAYLADAFDGTALDLHLKSTTGRWNGSGWTQDASLSPAVDAADPSSAYANEPAPNGSCANIGFFGNSAEASKSSVAIPELDSVTIAQGDDYTRPTFTITTGGSNPYSASVALYYTTTAPANANDPSSYADSVNVAFGVSFGETLHAATRQYFATGTTLYWLVTASNLNGSDSRNGSVILSGEAPPEYGKGGGAEVIHVWTGASGAADGSSWLDAVATLGEAALLVNASTGRTNIWIAGGLTLSSDGPDFDVPVSIRGGFTAIENTVGERPAGSSSALDGAATFRAMTLSATSGATMLERLSVRNCLGPAVAKNGAGSLSLVDCEFTGNGNATSVRGAAVRAVGTTAASSLFVTNCVFKGNWCSAESGSGTYETTRDHSGTGIYAESFQSVGLYDCAFTTNGPPVGNNSSAGRGSTFGGALRLNNAPATVERCFFTGNRTCSHKDSTSGDTVWIEGTGSGTVFRNCAFVGNSSFYADANSNAGRAAGVGVSLGNAAHTALFENCTFAWNVGHKGNGGAIDAVKGAVTVVNSIFFGNSVNTAVLGYTGLDLYAGTTATIAVSYSMFASTDAPYCASATAGAITFGDGVITGDPLFMTESVAVANPLYAPTFNPVAVAMNIHLRSKAGYTDKSSGERVTARGASPAIDAGAKGFAYALEPEPNGKRINLGCYGNTPWASSSVANCTVIMLR